jgi:hypothetical protein
MNLDDFLFLFAQGSRGGDGGENVRGNVASDLLHFQPLQSLHDARHEASARSRCTVHLEAVGIVLVHGLRTGLTLTGEHSPILTRVR